MNNKNIKLHAKIYAKIKALQAVADDLKPAVLKELKKMPDKKAIENGVEYHVTTSSRKSFTAKKVKDLTAELKELKEAETAAGRYKETITETFDAYVPKSAEEEIFSNAAPEYKKHFC